MIALDWFRTIQILAANESLVCWTFCVREFGLPAGLTITSMDPTFTVCVGELSRAVRRFSSRSPRAWTGAAAASTTTRACERRKVRTLFAMKPQPRRVAVKVAKGGSRVGYFHGSPSNARRAR